MEALFAVVAGGIFASAVYLMLSRNTLRFIFGLGLMTNAVNLLIFTVGRLTRGQPPLIPAGETVPPPGVANALPQALILTAIVIGFGLLAFSAVLVLRNFEELATVDPDAIRVAEPPEPTGAEPEPLAEAPTGVREAL
ncbi:Na+/H+ antiporter subunit C [Truepera radiovictrix]|uniref:Multisubunit sodium/proton antiporter, MrpC subunit (2.A.63.1) n=1 Tax=Truepera radiovictrix (strain DSM 17093 / CIP 108686 / LMG 22925 / RQ-24) TaxID=649638 RepID=D7CUJ7_TRURR|nr:Na+/H+ antiporter subunit C [Truepera radiovictrix]ADI15782.1 multisubunit sodium/proton antiporter, MrpC subunit (2.A.63.1) [Truepera radiovictrix DSM 17093]WMT58591.1 Na+/H+ antiporter subunit C [Truepera radiovictrix]